MLSAAYAVSELNALVLNDTVCRLGFSDVKQPARGTLACHL